MALGKLVNDCLRQMFERVFNAFSRFRTCFEVVNFDVVVEELLLAPHCYVLVTGAVFVIDQISLVAEYYE